MSTESTNLETIAIHGSMKDNPSPNEPVVPGIELSTIYEHRTDGIREEDWKYTRAGNPNRSQLEKVLASLEGGDNAAAFSSGVAAITSVFQAMNSGSHILVPDDVYFGTRMLVLDFAERWGLEVDFVDMTNPSTVEQALKANTAMIWVETPSNPLLQITDVAKMCTLAKKHGAIVAVDNTWPTPFNMQPFDLGADVVIHSTTKYLGGHSDILGGAVIVKQNDELFQKIRKIQIAQGAVPSSFDSWLLARSIRSFPLRMRVHNENAGKMAAFLNEHPKVREVFYPGLESHPGHEIAKAQMSGFGGMISFLIEGDEADALKIVHGTKIVTAATSLGGIESIWEHRRSTEGERSVAPKDLIRFSVGLEHIDDLIADVEQALDK